MKNLRVKKILRFSFIPASFFLWLLYTYATLENGSATDLSIVLLIFLLGIYTYRILDFLIKKFNLKIKALWFFYYFLGSTTVILLFEIVPFLDNLEVNGIFALLLLVSCGVSLILSLSFGIKMFIIKKLR